MSITIRNLKKHFDRPVFKDLNFEAEEGKITAIVGPNGCGKSTLFSIISGIVPKDAGECKIKNFDKFRFSYMFQNYRESILLWRNNRDNIALPLQIAKMPEQTIKKKISELDASFKLGFDLDAYPYELSGGQQQLLAFFRSLITKPNILLLDEPFSALDYENSILLGRRLQEYYLATKATVVVVTHNIEEAAYLGEEIVVFSSRPTKVLGRIKNPLPFPRTLDTMKTNEFHLVKKQVLELFQAAVGT